MSQQLYLNVLKQYWGYDEFRPFQEDIIHNIYHHKKDTLAILPTGGGKSLCYQLPTLLMDGMCLVISPLIALIKDQIENLHKKNIKALGLYQGMNYISIQQTIENAYSNQFKFLFVSPERLQSKIFQEQLSQMNICLIAVDEAHCISQWGHDFRKSYTKIAEIKSIVNNAPILALTASATQKVREDIIYYLEMQQPQIIQQSFARKNLSYSINNTADKINSLILMIKKINSCALVYCKTRKEVKRIYDILKLQQLSVDYYHAGLSIEDRNKKQQLWINDEKKILVCTNAFGMGIDKPNVRLIIHYDAPLELESYYQEAGRAGRDGKKAFSVILHHHTMMDIELLVNEKYLDEQTLQKVYDRLCNFLNIGINEGAEKNYSFNIDDFVQTLSLPPKTIASALRIFDQEDIIQLLDGVLGASTIHIKDDINTIEEFIKRMPQYKNVLYFLLRHYANILNIAVFINENYIARQLKKTDTELKQMLIFLDKAQIINYCPTKNEPQLLFKHNRIEYVKHLIDEKNFYERKEIYKQKLLSTQRYLDNNDTCRSIFIAEYFNDKHRVTNCGICDICLQKNAKNVYVKWDALNAIFYSIKEKELTMENFLKYFSLYATENVKAYIYFLEQEGKIYFRDNKYYLNF